MFQYLLFFSFKVAILFNVHSQKNFQVFQFLTYPYKLNLKPKLILQRIFQWAKIVVALERAIKKNDAERYLEEYSIALGGPADESSTEQPQRGVMVIKSKSKTRAKQRKGAVSNWKVRKSYI